MASKWSLVIILFFLVCSVSGYSEPGILDITLTPSSNIGDFQRSMYNNTKIIVRLRCSKPEAEIQVQWWLWRAECLQAFSSINNQTVEMYKASSEDVLLSNGAKFVASGGQNFDCNTYYVVNDYQKETPIEDLLQNIDDEDESLETDVPSISSTTTSAPSKKTTPTKSQPDSKESKPIEKQDLNQSQSGTNAAKSGDQVTDTSGSNRSKREAEKKKAEKAAVAKHPDDSLDDKETALYVTKADGIYLLLIEINAQGNVDMNLKMKTDSGYLSPIDWPNLPFYGTLCVLYVIYGIVWLVMLAMNWRDLLRIQFWIGAVILLGMLEKAVYFGEYESINSTGTSVRGALIFAELVSCLKRTLARMLVIIVSLGYGIVKPRLGADQNKVVGIGIVFFILSAVEACVRVAKNHGDRTNGKDMLGLLFMVTLLEVYICYWIFTSLVTTTRVLRLRRNVVKLSLYRHFTNTLVFAVLASLAFMIWSMSQHRFVECLSDWKEIWVDEAFWHMLFCVILLVIIILWRPSANNQRYAFSPLLDSVEEEDEDDTPISEAFDGMNKRPRDELRNLKNADKKKDKMDDDLKWIDENIPASVADAALPSLLDSDEEIVTTKFEVSKME